jgi:hypothetical protein
LPFCPPLLKAAAAVCHPLFRWHFWQPTRPLELASPDGTVPRKVPLSDLWHTTWIFGSQKLFPALGGTFEALSVLRFHRGGESNLAASTSNRQSSTLQIAAKRLVLILFNKIELLNVQILLIHDNVTFWF